MNANVSSNLHIGQNVVIVNGWSLDSDCVRGVVKAIENNGVLLLTVGEEVFVEMSDDAFVIGWHRLPSLPGYVYEMTIVDHAK